MRKTGWSAVLAFLACALLLVPLALGAEGGGGGAGDESFDVYRKIGLGAAAAFAISMCVFGAGYAVARIGSAAIGAAAEKPELLNRSLVFVALAEGLAVLGFVIAIMLVQKI